MHFFMQASENTVYKYLMYIYSSNPEHTSKSPCSIVRLCAIMV